MFFNKLDQLDGLNLSFQNKLCAKYNKKDNTLLVKCRNLNILPTENTNDKIWKETTNKSVIKTQRYYTNDPNFIKNNELLLIKFNSTKDKIRKLYLKLNSRSITLEFKKIEFNQDKHIFVIELQNLLPRYIEKNIYRVDYIVIDDTLSTSTSAVCIPVLSDIQTITGTPYSDNSQNSLVSKAINSYISNLIY